MKTSAWLLSCVAAVSLCSTPVHADSLQYKLKDGTTWRGQTGDSVIVVFMENGVAISLEGKITKAGAEYLTVEGTISGIPKTKTLFRSDIVSIKSAGSAVRPATDKPSETPKASGEPRTTVERSTDKVAEATVKPDVAVDSSKLGVFVLPLVGDVGKTYRHEEVEKLGAFIDRNYGPGQIIVLLINSNGGSSPETQTIGKVIRDLRTRHRVVAWIEKALSAGCQTAMYCNEIYFKTSGTAGSVTTWNPGTGQAVRGEMLDKILEEFAAIAEENGYSRHMANSMKLNEYQCSYDKDPVTGKVTFYGDLSGEYDLSGPNENLCLNASNALHCGFSKGTADTEEDLAKLLDLPKWNEISDYGRKIAADWQQTCKQAEEEIPHLIAKLNRGGGALTAQEAIGTQIRLLNDLINWYNRCKNVAQTMMPPPEVLERQLAELRKQLADMKRRQ